MISVKQYLKTVDFLHLKIKVNLLERQENLIPLLGWNNNIDASNDEKTTQRTIHAIATMWEWIDMLSFFYKSITI
jgi:hypothetical protein